MGSPWGKMVHLLLFLTTLDYTHFGKDASSVDGVMVFDFLPESDVKRVAKVKLWYGSGALSLPCTLCVWLQPGYKATSGRLLTAWDSNNFLTINSVNGRLYGAVNQSGLAPFNTPQLDAYTWSHLCLALTHTSTSLYLNTSKFEMDLGETWPYDLEENETEDVAVQLGANRNGFSGRVAELKIFNRELNAAQMIELARCRSNTSDHLASYNMSLVGGIDNESKPIDYMCQPQVGEFLALFEVPFNQSSSRTFCQSLNGRLINRNDSMSSVSREILENRDVDDDVRVAWMEEVLDGVFGEVVYLAKKSTGNIYFKLTRKTSVVLPMVACIIPAGKRMYLKKNDVKEFYLYSRRDQLILQSDNGDVILKSKCLPLRRDCLVHQQMGDPLGYSEIKHNNVILGRKVWKKFGDGKEYTATLSTCGDDSFTCSDSHCIELSNRCDGQPQCLDGSDEGNTCSLMEDHPSYRPMECPVLHPKVNLHVHLHGVSDVALGKNEFSATLSITVSWMDHRLTFTNLNNYTRKIRLGEFHKLWTPELKFANARYEDNLHIQTRTGVLEEYSVRALNPGRPDVRNSYEVRSYNGSEVRNTRTIQYLFTFSCEYNLFAFPFDIQECDMNLQLVSSPGCEPQWNVKNYGIHTTGTESTVSMYDISRIRYFYDNSSTYTDTVSFKLLFYRRYEAYLLTTFGPCIILYLLSELTLTHFQLDGFTDRITVTLSLLIVIASLFSQVSSSLPSSPVPKFVDWFFFYCILRVSFVFFLHSIIDKRRRSLQEGKSSNTTSTNAAEKIAWDTKPRTSWRSRFNKPAVVNNVGIAILTVSDVVILCLFVVWITLDQNDKTGRFYLLNVTQNNSSM